MKIIKGAAGIAIIVVLALAVIVVLNIAGHAPAAKSPSSLERQCATEIRTGIDSGACDALLKGDPNAGLP